MKLHYYGRRIIIVTPFVNQQFSLQVVERGREFQFVEQFISDKGVTPAGRHTAHRRPDSMHTARPSTFFFIWPSTLFRDQLPFICGRSRSTGRTACRMGHVRLFVCCRHLIQCRGHWAGAGLVGTGLAACRACDNYLRLLSSSVKLRGRRTCVWLCGYDAAFLKYFDLLLHL